jgi:heme-degrading monooxygenase HmoA
MFARVSTFKTGPQTTRDAPTDETVQRVIAIPGCKGIYFLNGTDTDSALAITLWDSAESLASSQKAANSIRSDTSQEQGMQIASVEEFEVTATAMKD